MGRKDPTEVFVAVHFNSPERPSVMVSIDGDASKAVPIARSLIESFHLTGKTTRGTDRNGRKVIVPLANMVVPYWLAADRGFI